MAQRLAFSWMRFLLGVTLAFCATLIVPTHVHAKDEGWKLQPTARGEVGVVSAQTATRDEQIVVDGDAFTFRAQVGLDLENDTTRFRIEADRIEVVRLGDGRRDSNRNRLTVQIDHELNDDWDIELRGRIYDDLVTAESSDTDEKQASVQLTYQPKRAHRFQLRGSWRDREYDNGGGVGSQTSGEGPRVDAQYRYRFGRYHYLTFDLRAESIESDDPQRGYARESAKVSYTRPLTRNLRIRPALEYLSTRYDGRLTPTTERREDHLVVPEVEVLWWPGKWRIEAEAKYISSSSNLLSRQREGHRLTLTVGYVF